MSGFPEVSSQPPRISMYCALEWLGTRWMLNLAVAGKLVLNPDGAWHYNIEEQKAEVYKARFVAIGALDYICAQAWSMLVDSNQSMLVEINDC